MTKKVYFYSVDLVETATRSYQDYFEIKELIVDIINSNAQKYNNFWVIDLTANNELHYVADIFSYENDYLFLRLSSQKPSGGYLHRNYATNIPEGVLEGVDEKDEGIEVYTYALLDYSKGIFSIVNQQSAPNYKVINYLFSEYNSKYCMEFKAIPNPDGIERIYQAQEPRITQVEIEVPVPDASTLEKMFGWNEEEIMDIQGKGLKATMKLSGIDRRIITDTEEESRGLIDCIKNKLATYNKARIRAKAEGIKTQEYSFLEENFSYPIDIPKYEIVGDKKRFYSADEMVSIYKEHLTEAYGSCKLVLHQISNR